VTSLCAPAAQRRDIDALELHASAIDTSDYVAALALVRRAVLEIGRLLDVGAGASRRTSTDSPPIPPIAVAGPRVTCAAPNSSAISSPKPRPTPPARLDIARKPAVLFLGSR
jgi:hypothetical protein